MFLLVEYWKWWNKSRLGLPIESKDGLKIATLEQMLEGRETWDEVCAWARKNAKYWRREMNK